MAGSWFLESQRGAVGATGCRKMGRPAAGCWLLPAAAMGTRLCRLLPVMCGANCAILWPCSAESPAEGNWRWQPACHRMCPPEAGCGRRHGQRLLQRAALAGRAARSLSSPVMINHTAPMARAHFPSQPAPPKVIMVAT